SSRTKGKTRNSKLEGSPRKSSCFFDLHEFRNSIFEYRILQNVAAEILVLDDVCQLFADVGGIDFHILLLEVRRFERNLIKNLFKNGMQAARADVFGLFVHAGGIAGHGRDGVLGDIELDAFGLEESDILVDQRVLWFGKNANEVFFLKGLQFDADRQPPLEFRNQVGRLCDVEGAGRDEENVIGANHAVARIHRSAFDNGQNVALHALARDIRPVAGLTPCDFVDLVDEDDAHLLRSIDSHASDLIHVEKLVFFFLNQILESIGHAHFAFFLLLAKHARKHVLDIDVHLLNALIGNDLKGRHGPFTDLDI